ncbi:helix-turn-helix domain-containing protein [Cryptosporangium japonicum]|uniref:HTH cro/C1-type domain-containing protein n=1 Tax=Cryptosporangium japonicum TaxID=80872 RepID=A0ABP3EUL5_9ACTN
MAPTTQPSTAEIGAAIRARRLELGLTIEQAAASAGVGSESWRRYEQGKAIRRDKVRGLCRVLRWANLPASDGEAAARTPRADPNWDAATEWAGFSTAVAARHGEARARAFELGFQLVVAEQLEHDLEALRERPRGSHLGELSESWLANWLPERFVTHYEYELLYRLRAASLRIADRLASRTSQLTRCPAEALMLYVIVEDGAGEVNREVDYLDWMRELIDEDLDAVRTLFDRTVDIPVDHPWHYKNWFEIKE